MLAKPLNPMVLLIIIPFLNGYFIGKINPIFRQANIWYGNCAKFCNPQEDRKD